MYEFIELFAPHLTRARVDAVCATSSKQDIDAMFASLALPEH
jgi:LysR family cys regulon transcriptional activator